MKKFLAFFLILATVILPIVSSFAACNHIWSEWVISRNNPPTCQKTGTRVRTCTRNNCGSHEYQTVAKVPHDYKPATCTKPATCKFGCGATTGAPLGHALVEATCVSKRHCNRGDCNYTEGQLGPHKFSVATCIKASTCSVCGVTTGTLKPHNFTGATCTRRGSCSHCGAPGTYKPHEYVNGKCTMCKRDEPFLNDVPSTTDPA